MANRKKILGKYVSVATDYALEDGSADKPYPTAVVRFTVVEGPKTGQTRTYFGSLHEKCQDFTVKALRAAGMTNDDITKPVGIGNVKCVLTERENVYNGKTTARIDFVDPLEAAKLKAFNPVKDTAKMASRFAKLFGATKPLEVSAVNAAPSSLPTVASEPAASIDNDIDPNNPF